MATHKTKTFPGKTQNSSLPYSRWTWVILAGTGMSLLWMLLQLRVMEVVVTTGAKTLVKSSPTTDQHPTFYRPDVLPVSQPTVSKH